VEIDINSALQEGYLLCLQRGNVFQAEQIEWYSRLKGIKLTRPEDKVPEDKVNEAKEELYLFENLDDEEIMTIENLQQIINDFKSRLEGKQGVGLEEAQRTYELIAQGYHLSLGYYAYNIEMLEEFEKYCQGRDIELQNIRKAKEQMYKHLIHNNRAGHARKTREDVFNMIRAAGSELTYEEVAKMDYLKDLNVPEEQQLRQTVEAHVDVHPITVRLYGKRQDKPMGGKFIVGITPEQGLELVFDGTLGEHGDIGVKYDLQVIGGGWLKIDEQENRVIISKKSQDFGFDPRSITAKALSEAFPGYTVEER
jgi:hypothetical protein